MSDTKKKGIEENISYKLPFSERVGRNSVFNLAGNIFNYVLRFILIPFVIGFIETTFGFYYIITSYAALVILFSHLYNFGIDLSSSKFVSEYFSLNDEKKLNTIYSTTLFLKIFSSTITTIILSIVMFLLVPYQIDIEPSLINMYIYSCVFLIVGTFFYSIISTYTHLLRGFQRNDFVVFITTITNLLIVVSKFIFIFLGFSILGLIISDYIFLNIEGIIVMYLIKKRYKNLKFRFDLIKWKNIKKYGSQGLSYYFSNLDESLFIDLNIVLIPQILPIQDPSADVNQNVLIYGTSLKLSRYGMALTSSLSGGQVAIATELYSKGKYDKFRELFGRLFNLSFFLSILIASGVSILAPRIIIHYIGPIYRDFWPILAAFVFMYAFRMNVFLCKKMLQSMDLMHKAAYIAFLEYGLIITFSILGFLLYSLIGLSFGVFLAVLIYSVILLIYTAKKIKYSMKSLLVKVIKIFFAVLIPIIILYILKYYNILQFTNFEGLIYLIYDFLILGAFAGIGLLVFYLIKGFHQDDLDALLRTLRGIYKTIKRRLRSILGLNKRKIKNKKLDNS